MASPAISRKARKQNFSPSEKASWAAFHADVYGVIKKGLHAYPLSLRRMPSSRE